MSSFGSPGGGKMPTKPKPPQKGSFPLDHDGECTSIMKQYLSCLKGVRGMNDKSCRQLAKGYLECRMDNNLMARDELKNLGFREPLATSSKGPGATPEGLGPSTPDNITSSGSGQR